MPDGLLAWSIGFSDAVRSEITPSRTRNLYGTMSLRITASSDQDSLLGSNGAIVGTESLMTNQTIPAEGKIRGTLILTLTATSTTAKLSEAGSTDTATIATIDPFSSPWNRSLSALGVGTNQAESASIF